MKYIKASLSLAAAMPRLLSLIVGVLVLSSSAYAGSITWTLSGSGGGGSWGNSLSFTSGGVTVTASAWGYTYGSSDDALETAALGQWSTGLGVCDRYEGLGSSCESPEHQVDNIGPDNWILFTFSQAIDPTTIRIDPYGTWDRDVSYWLRPVTAASPLSLNGKTYSDLTSAAIGFGSRIDQSYTASGDPLDVPIVGSTLVNALLFGAKKGSPTGSDEDGFKIKSLTAEVPVTVPEVSSLMFLSAGFVGLVYRYRRIRP